MEYYQKHKCVQCGKTYKAVTPRSTHCPECMHSAPNQCEYCGAEFTRKRMSSRFCPSHRYMQSPAFIRKQQNAKKETLERRAKRKMAETDRKEEIRKIKREAIARKKEIKETEKTKPKNITEAVVLSHKPEVVSKEKEIHKPIDNFFLKVGKARYGFTTEERMEIFKKLNGLV